MKRIAIIQDIRFSTSDLYSRLESLNFEFKIFETRLDFENFFRSDQDFPDKSQPSPGLKGDKDSIPFHIFIDPISTDYQESTDFYLKLKEQKKDLAIVAVTDRLELLSVPRDRFRGFDFLVFPFGINDIVQAINKSHNMESTVALKPIDLPESVGMGNIIGKSRKMREIYRLIWAIADKDISVFISGESGTGKELVAQAVHHNSPRNQRPFIKVNCAAIPENLIESELFGHEKGAFTGAYMRKHGKFELANGGTLFLDEVGDMSLNTQAKVLRVIQEKEFERVGGKETVKVDVRLIAATHRDLREEVQQERFREDLYYRLNVINIHIPPLRERREDIVLLADFFLDRFNKKFGKKIVGFSVEVLKGLVNAEWRGNVRELQNIIESAIALENTDMIQASSIPSQLRPAPKKPLPEQLENKEAFFERCIEMGITLSEMEKGMFIAAMKKSGNIQKDAAKMLGIQKGKIQYNLKKYSI